MTPRRSRACLRKESMKDHRKERAAAREKAKALVAQMTLEEKASQLRYDAPAIPRLGIPAYNYWNEALHGVARAGVATMFPQAIGMAAMFDEDAMQEIGDIIATEGRAKYNEAAAKEDRDIYKGLTFWSPNINIFRDPRWGRGQETYGEDPYLTTRLGLRFVEGIQGDGPVMKAAACAKHFAVHSGPEAIRHEFNAEVTLKDMWETYLPAFEALVTEGDVEAVMGAYNRTNGEPCCGHSYLMEEVLRGKWKFDGHFTSDCWAIQDFHMHHMVTSTPQESAALALKKGCDVNCGITYLHLLSAYQEGLVTEEEISLAAERLFTTRFLLGLFDGSEYDSIPYEEVESKAHLATALKAAEKGCVLLKNDGILPLKKENLKTIGVIGPNANSRAALVGNYHGTASRYTTVLEGIQDAVGDEVRVLYSEGCHLFREKVEGLGWRQDRLAEAETVAEHSDVVVLCVGLDETLEGEEGDAGNADASGDKKDLHLPKVQEELIECVTAVGKPVVVVLVAGSAIDLSYSDTHDNAILLAMYPGAQGGKAVADLLFGKESPSGKLPVTFYRDLAGMPEFTDYSMKNRTYRYMEGEALYPFGYGLSYADIRVTDAAVREEAGGAVPGQEGCPAGVTVQVTAKNSGSCAADEVLQIYVKDLESPLAPRNYSLCAFKRIRLAAGEEKTFCLPVDGKAFTVVNEDGERVCGSGKYILYAGTSQPDARSVALTGKKPVEISFNR